MRIISGSARGTRLTTFSGSGIRPTSDRVRAALFSMLLSRISTFDGKNILDICSGSGALAIEALSRGAASAICIDSAAQAHKLIHSNSIRCHVEDRLRIRRGSAQQALPELGGKQFDVIFLDPPYGKNMVPAIIDLIAAADLLATDGYICAEESSDYPLALSNNKYTLEQQRSYGSTTIYLYTTTETAS